MNQRLTAEAVYKNFTKLPANERAKFFSLLAEPPDPVENVSHVQVFGHLAGDDFTAADAAGYLEMSMSTFRRHVSHGRIRASGEVGNQLFATTDLKAFKRSLKDVKARRSS